MTTDLKSKTDEDSLAGYIRHELGSFNDDRKPVVILVQELAGRLEAAQQQIVAQQARIAEQSKLIDQLIDTDGADVLLAAQVLAKTDDMSLLAAHDAEMKAEALEDFLSLLHEAVGFCGHCGKRACAGRQSNSRLPGEINLDVVLNAITKAKAGRNG